MKLGMNSAILIQNDLDSELVYNEKYLRKRKN